MFREVDIQTAFVTWVSTVTGLKVVKEKQAQPRPDKPYASLNFTSAGLTESTTETIVTPVAGSPSTIALQEETEGGVVSIQLYASTENNTSIWDSIELLKKSVKNPLTKYAYFKASQTDVVTIGTITPAATYTVTIYGVDISIVSDASPTDVEIRDALIVAINDSDYIWGVTAAVIGAETDTILISGATQGQTYSITAKTANMTVARLTYALDVALVDAVAITDLTTLNNPAWEPRVIFDLRYNYNSSLETDLGAIENVAAAGTVGGLPVTITVP